MEGFETEYSIEVVLLGVKLAIKRWNFIDPFPSVSCSVELLEA